MRPGGNQLAGDRGFEYEEQVKPDLLDFLFTLALTIGIAPELVGRDGLASYSWVIAVPEGEFIVNILGFLLAISTLLFSWYGFNSSISNKPVLYGSVSGMLRFFLDALLVVLYGFMLIMFDRLDVLVILLSLIFVLYTVWDLLKEIEYCEEPFDFSVKTDSEKPIATQIGPLGRQVWSELTLLNVLRTARERRSVIYLIFILPVAGFQISPLAEQFGPWKHILLVVILLIITILYRIDKVKYQFRGKDDYVSNVKDTEEGCVEEVVDENEDKDISEE